MQYVGIDLHRKFSQVHVHDDQTAEETTQRLNNDELLLRAFFINLDGACKIAV